MCTRHPEATDLQALFAVMRERGVEAVAMEVSSHALALGRVDGTTFDVAVFTNLSQDHLDFHADLEDYFAAKARLFTSAFTKVAVVDVDDAYGARLAVETEVRVVTVSPRGNRDADWWVDDVAATSTGRRSSCAVPMAAPRGPCRDCQVRSTSRNAALAVVALVEAGGPMRKSPSTVLPPASACPVACNAYGPGSRSRHSSTTHTPRMRWQPCSAASARSQPVA